MKTWHEQHQSESNIAGKIADKVSAFVGSWAFLILHVVWFGVWIAFKAEPFPYGLLTMIVSLEAILLSTIIMISQTRAGDRDRVQAQNDYKINEAAKLEIEQLQVAIARVEGRYLKDISKKLDVLCNKTTRTSRKQTLKPVSKKPR